MVVHISFLFLSCRRVHGNASWRWGSSIVSSSVPPPLSRPTYIPAS
uniref:Uncharacterized protein n=1 Tax=Anguilla anguilla TaxID=7936 RepID=A0A0E9VZC0_ANGAN